MKLDFNNIDEVFKDGLEDYTEQPSGNVWKNISGKMFWYDLLHLRFGNIPKAWLGAVAGILIMAVLIGIWAIPGSDETTVLFEDTGVKASQDGLQNAQPEITSDQAKQSVINVEIVESVDKSANQQPATNIIKSPLANDQGQESLKADQPEMEILTIPSTTAETMGIQNVSPDIQSSDQLSGGKSGTSEVNEYQMTEVAGIRATATNPGQGSDANRTASEKPGKMQDEVSFGVATEISDNRIGPENDPSSFENESAVEGVRKTGSADTELENLIEINQAMGAMKKMPKPGGISFNTVQPVHYGRRPAKRNYQYPQGFFNRGYQPYFSISAYFAPEVTEYHRLASKSRENSWLAGVAVSYNTERYIIQTGLEYSVFDDLGDYMVNINSYDSIGFYEGVSGFEIDPENPGELIYHTHTVEVWDTVQHHSHQQTRNNYAYLQIPVMFGYKAMESGIFSAHIKAGPSFSFLLNRDEPTLDFQTGPGARISSVDNFTASRLNTNVQVLVSLALRLQFTERIGLLAEPTYRYYFNSVYDINDETLKNPYGIGVRGGIFFNFK